MVLFIELLESVTCVFYLLFYFYHSEYELMMDV